MGDKCLFRTLLGKDARFTFMSYLRIVMPQETEHRICLMSPIVVVLLCNDLT